MQLTRDDYLIGQEQIKKQREKIILILQHINIKHNRSRISKTKQCSNQLDTLQGLKHAVVFIMKATL